MGWELLDLAVMGGCPEIVGRLLFLLGVRADVSRSRKAFQFYGCQYFSAKMNLVSPKALSPRPYQVWADGCEYRLHRWSILDTAIRAGQDGIFKRLMRFVDVDNMNPSGFLVHHAVALSRHAIVGDLLNHPRFKDSFTRRDPLGLTPLWIAYNNNDKAMIQLLLTNGANINQELDHRKSRRSYDNFVRNYTVLADACLFGKFEIALFLIHMGADVNVECSFTNFTGSGYRSSLFSGNVNNIFHDEPSVRRTSGTNLVVIPPLQLRIIGRTEFEKDTELTEAQTQEAERGVLKLLLKRGARLDQTPHEFNLQAGKLYTRVHVPHDLLDLVSNPSSEDNAGTRELQIPDPPPVIDAALLAAMMHRVNLIKSFIEHYNDNYQPFLQGLDIARGGHSPSFSTGIMRVLVHAAQTRACKKTANSKRRRPPPPNHKLLCSHNIELIEWFAKNTVYWTLAWLDIQANGTPDEIRFWGQAVEHCRFRELGAALGSVKISRKGRRRRQVYKPKHVGSNAMTGFQRRDGKWWRPRRDRRGRFIRAKRLTDDRSMWWREDLDVDMGKWPRDERGRFIRIMKKTAA